MEPSKTDQCARPLRIAFVHPDLGLGGAERLIVDAAAELAAHGHSVHIYTAHYDPARCFDETRTGAFSVTQAGAWFPRAIGGRLLALCAIVRCALVSLYIAWAVRTGRAAPFDVVIVDQVAAVVPLLRLLLPHAHVLFYCHFPDLLLSTQRASLLKRLYRAPLDAVEESATGAADALLVNSRFTGGVFAATFKRLDAHGIKPQVLYPCVAIPSSQELAAAQDGWRSELEPALVQFVAGGPTFLSINRFERKKGIALALQALHELRARRGAGCAARLVVAGGYDPRLPENVEHLEELKALAQQLGLGADSVHFLPSFSDRQRTLLLAACAAVVYTPQHEHFGIVPLEAMAAARPVIACNNGGPTESVVHGQTGLLCEPTPAAFAAAYEAILEGGSAGGMGPKAREHVCAKFSRRAFGDDLEAHVLAMLSQQK